MVWPRLLRHGVQSRSIHNFRDGAAGEPSAEVDFLSFGDRTGDFGAAGRNSGVHFEGVLRVLPAFGGAGSVDFSVVPPSGSA